MAVSPRPSFSSMPSEPGLRRLGVGRGSGGERPLRAQLVVAVVIGLMLMAVPLYLWRRPSMELAAEGGAAPEAANVAVAVAARVLEEPKGHEPEPASAEFSSVVRVSCSSAPNRKGESGELCDRLPFFEKALTDAVQSAAGCVPKTGKAGSINYVLTVDFTRRKLHVFPGQSGDWKGPSARRATECVAKALPKPDFATIAHKYRYYVLAQMVRYPAPAIPTSSKDGGLFE
jgi:hypothetical protein